MSPLVATRRAGRLLIAAGVVIVLGSFDTWVVCSTVGCDGPPQAFDFLSGIELAVGWLTAISGAILVGLGVWAVRCRFDERGAQVAFVSGILVTMTVIVTLVLAYGVPSETSTVDRPPGMSGLVVILGGLIATAGGCVAVVRPASRRLGAVLARVACPERRDDVGRGDVPLGQQHEGVVQQVGGLSGEGFAARG